LYGDDDLDFQQLLKELGLPEDMAQVLEKMPEDVRAYILDEILEEALARVYTV